VRTASGQTRAHLAQLVQPRGRSGWRGAGHRVDDGQVEGEDARRADVDAQGTALASFARDDHRQERRGPLSKGRSGASTSSVDMAMQAPPKSEHGTACAGMGGPKSHLPTGRSSRPVRAPAGRLRRRLLAPSQAVRRVAGEAADVRHQLLLGQRSAAAEWTCRCRRASGPRRAGSAPAAHGRSPGPRPSRRRSRARGGRPPRGTPGVVAPGALGGIGLPPAAPDGRSVVPVTADRCRPGTSDRMRSTVARSAQRTRIASSLSIQTRVVAASAVRACMVASGQRAHAGVSSSWAMSA